MKTRYQYCSLAATLLMFVAAGCGSEEEGPDVFEITGTVTLDGEPLSEGDITFRVVEGPGSSAYGKIEDGQFSFESRAGNSRVEISSKQKLTPDEVEEIKKKKKAAGDNSPTYSDYYDEVVPPQYNVKTELTAEVTKDGPHEFNFELKSGE